MILRALTLAGGLAAGAATSQFPEFSQQYAQRLGGAVDALSQVVADFDASAAQEGLTRSAALDQMNGTAFVERRRKDMERTFDRHAKLSADLDALQGQGPFTRAYHAARMTDGDVAGAAWDNFQPALPLNFAGAVFAGVGFLAGMIGLGAVLAVLRWPLRFMRRTHA
ncbi:DUF2937 family protein [Ascidiaceihabitans sp.]|uniref:DUF2937 family protein n=1 Tax=Ascidiaceihabitans sp. TaxID=1872644 RepID=UPI0032989ECF